MNKNYLKLSISSKKMVKLVLKTYKIKIIAIHLG